MRLRADLEAKFGAAPAPAHGSAAAAMAPADAQQMKAALRVALTLSGPDAVDWTQEHSGLVRAPPPLPHLAYFCYGYRSKFK